MANMERYRELEKEQQILERSIHRRAANIETLVSHITALTQILEEYRAGNKWLDIDQYRQDEFNPDIETRTLLAEHDISAVIQECRLNKSYLSATTAKLTMELKTLSEVYK